MFICVIEGVVMLIIGIWVWINFILYIYGGVFVREISCFMLILYKNLILVCVEGNLRVVIFFLMNYEKLVGFIVDKKKFGNYCCFLVFLIGL